MPLNSKLQLDYAMVTHAAIHFNALVLMQFSGQLRFASHAELHNISIRNEHTNTEMLCHRHQRTFRVEQKQKQKKRTEIAAPTRCAT